MGKILSSSLLAGTLVAALLTSGCSTLQLRRTYNPLNAAVQNAQHPFVAYTWNARDELSYTNAFHAAEPLGLMYVAEPMVPRDISKNIHFRIVRDDPYDVFGYETNEILVEPRHLSAYTNHLGSTTYSYAFERAGIVSQELLGPAKQYRCTAEYWGNGKNPARLRFSEAFYLIPAINMVFVYLDFRAQNAAKPFSEPIIMQQTIKIRD